MKNSKTMYFKVNAGRKNIIGEFILNSFLSIFSFPRMAVECLIRRNMGERYFNLATYITVAVLLFFLPALPFASNGGNRTVWDTITENMGYYAYLAVYLFFGLNRWRETRTGPSVFNLGKYSLYTGDILPFFKRFKNKDGAVNFRLIECWLEPLAILIAALLFSIASPLLCYVLIFCSIVYCISYLAQYHHGDTKIMDLLDGRIIGEEMEDIIMGRKNPNQARGVQARFRRPDSDELRKRLIDEIRRNDDDDDDEEPSVAA